MDQPSGDPVRAIVSSTELPLKPFRLPNAPTTKFYCVYGHGKDTEVSPKRMLPPIAHTYPFNSDHTGDSSSASSRPLSLTTPRYTREGYEHDEVQADSVDAQCANTTDCTTPRAPLDLPLLRRSQIDAEYTDEAEFPRVLNGVRVGEGDGTVNLLSLGAMCVEGWKRKRWNPAGIEVVTVEVRRAP